MRKIFYLAILFTCLFQNVNGQNATWTDGVACIVYSHCTSCHNTNGIAPFSLTTYSDAFLRRYSIAAAVQDKRMPPFPPNQDKQKYGHANTLTATEIQQLQDWVSNSAPLGNASNVPTPPVYSTNYQMVNADLVKQIPNFTVNTTTDLYRCFVLPANNSTQQMIQSLEVVPGDRSIVHHVLVYQDTSSIPLNLDLADPLPGYIAFGGTASQTSQLISGYTPGQGVFNFAPGFGAKLLPNSYIILQIHYPAGTNNAVDSTQIRMKYGSSTLRNVTTAPYLNHTTSLTNGPLFIPANTVKTFYSQVNSPYNLTLTGIMPHMHLIGTKIKAYYVKPTGDTIPLIDIPKWDFHWQGFYQFQKPLFIPIGSVVYGEATYDNTSSNPNNPTSPPQNVSLGESTTDEMMLIYFNLSAYLPGDTSIIIDTSSHYVHHESCNSVAFPLNIVSFTGAINNNITQLQWRVENEQDVKNYSIERSIDGINFSMVGNKNSVNAASALYDFTDYIEGVNSSIIYYRIKQMNKSGEVFYSNKIALQKVEKENQYAKIYPNPVTNFLLVNFNSLTRQEGTINIYSIAGKLVYSKMYSIQKGYNSITINELGKLTKGAYLLEVLLGDGKLNGKFVK